MQSKRSALDSIMSMRPHIVQFIVVIIGSTVVGTALGASASCDFYVNGSVSGQRTACFGLYKHCLNFIYRQPLTELLQCQSMQHDTASN